MGTGWRRALCTSVQRDDDDAVAAKAKKRRPRDASPRAGGFFSSKGGGGGGGGGSNPATPKLRCRTKPLQEPPEPAPVTPPSAPAAVRKLRVPLLQALSAPTSPSRFALLKASLLPSKSRCGVCSRGVKSGGGSAVFTAECSHTFHFPCIAGHARSSSAGGALSCPVCASPWRQAPFLASLRLHCYDDDRTAPSVGGGHTKAYDDDEPLAAPKAAGNGGGFNPIPEADDEGNEEEFRGFFPPQPRPSRASSSSGLAVTVAPEAALVSSGRRHGRYVVAVKVKAPSSSSSSRRRAPIDLVTVLDVSQGMTGEKLQALKRGMRLVVASLGPADRLSIVAFAGAAKRLLPLRRMTRQGQRAARQIVDRLVVCASSQEQPSSESQQQGSACVGDALRKATKVLEDRRDRNPVATVMLLSDTQQQQQQQQQEARKQQQQARRPSVVAAPAATRFTHVEIPIGDDAPPHRPHAATPKEAEEKEEHAFAKCLGGLVSVVMQEVHLELLFPTGEVTAVYSSGGPGQPQAVSVAGGGGTVSVRLGEMYAEEERELLVELRAPLAVAAQRNRPQLCVRCSYRDPASQDAVRGADQPLPLPPLGSAASSSRRLHDLFVATRAVAESRRLAELQDLGTAIHLLSSARALVTQPPPSQDLVAGLDTELSDMRWRRRTQQSRSRCRRDAASEATTPVGTPRGGSSSGPAGGEALTPTSAWRAAEQLAKVAIMRKSMNRVSDLHGFENARF